MPCPVKPDVKDMEPNLPPMQRSVRMRVVSNMAVPGIYLPAFAVHAFEIDGRSCGFDKGDGAGGDVVFVFA
jgi:hypothetical protein